MRSTSSSAVLREFTIQSRSAYAAKRRCARLGACGTPEAPRARTTAAWRPWSARQRERERGCSRRSGRGRCRREPSRSKASSGSYSWIRTSIAGCDAARSAITGSSERRIAVAKPATRSDAGGLGARVEVAPGGVDGGQDGDGVVGEPAPGRGQPHPPAVRLDQRRCRPRGPGRRAAARRSTWSMPSSSATSRIEPSRESSRSRRRRRTSIALIVQRLMNDMSSKVTWTRTISRGSLVA